MTTACCLPATPLNLRQPPSQGWLAALHRVWAAWRAQSLRRSQWRVLDELSDSTRRDIGLPERAPPAPTRALWDHERGLW